MAATHPDRFSSICVVDTARDDAPSRLEYWVRERGMRGVRLFSATTADDPSIDDPRSLAVLDTAQALQIPVTVVMRHDSLDRLTVVARRFPALPIVIDHLVRYPVTERPPYSDSAAFLALADHPNVSLKFSTVNQWAIRKMVKAGALASEREYFKIIVDRFGADRLMWGSNYPVTRYKPYDEMHRMGAEPFDFLDASQVDAIMGGNALRVFWKR
jgi:L-fuconolactonase